MTNVAFGAGQGKEVQGGGQYRENMLISLGVRALQRAEKGLKNFVGDANSTLSGKIAIQPRPEIDFARQNRTQPLRKEKAKGGGTCLVGLDSAHRTEAVFPTYCAFASRRIRA